MSDKALLHLIKLWLDSTIPMPQSIVPVAVPPDDADLARLLAAVSAGDGGAVAALLGRRPELARAHGPDGQTALHAAAWCDDARLGLRLLAAGADPQAKFGQSGHTALSWGVMCKALCFVRALVQAGCPADLFCAAGSGNLELVRSFFDEAGALRAGASTTGSSRLDSAGQRLPCPPDTATGQISDALYIASRNAQVDVVRFLLGHGPDLSFRAYIGGTPLHWAHFGGSPTIVALLEQAGADAAARDTTLGCTPRAFGICVPANWGFVELVRERLAADRSLATLHDGGTTPLHEGARSGNAEVVRALLDAGADPAALNAEGQTPRDIAQERGHQSLSSLLGGGS